MILALANEVNGCAGVGIRGRVEKLIAPMGYWLLFRLAGTAFHILLFRNKAFRYIADRSACM